MNVREYVESLRETIGRLERLSDESLEPLTDDLVRVDMELDTITHAAEHNH